MWVCLLAIFAGQAPHVSKAETQVDLELVLTVDVSLSMDLDEQRLQRDGYVAAFRDPLVLAAIASGAHRRIGVIYIEWAGPFTQSTVLPWTLIDGVETAERFASALEKKPISRDRMTSISGALLYADRVLEKSPYRAPRRVIDVSGDGPNNAGGPIVPTRDELVARGIIINGLPLMLKTGGEYGNFDIPNLDQYYADCVIGGPGSFSIPVRDKAEIGAAIRQKLVLEIADLGPRDPLPDLSIIPVQSTPQPPRADCLIGEKLWQRYLDGRGFR